MSNPPQLIRRILLACGLTFALVIAAGALWLRIGASVAQAGNPPPGLPPFEGNAVSVDFPVRVLAGRPTEPRATQLSGWQVAFAEDWESGFDSNTWTTIDRDGAANGDYRWDTRPIENTIAGGDLSAWSVGGGQDGVGRDPETDGYPGNADSWLIYGPMDMTGIEDADLSFNYLFEADAGDVFSVLLSTDTQNWEGKQTDNGGNGQWLGRSYALSEFAGQPAVYLAFTFESNANGDPNKFGAFVDDIVIRFNYGNKAYLPHVQVQPSPTPTVPPTPTATATPPSGVAYLNEFTDIIDGWTARRSTIGANFDFAHRGDTDGDRQGFLELELSGRGDYFIVSPLVPAKAPPYNIEYVAKLKDVQHRDMHGVVFGGNWNGQACQAPGSANCFTHYYELRVEFNDDEDRQYMKLKRIDGHDANGDPVGPTLIDWVNGARVERDEWVEIDVKVEADGTISISFNDRFRATIKDDALINEPYFGLIIANRDYDNSRVKYDYIKID